RLSLATVSVTDSIAGLEALAAEDELMIRCLLLVLIIGASMVASRATVLNTRTVIYDGLATEVAAATDASPELWITTSDLARATRFAIKPQGVCRDELCFPLPKNRTGE